MAQVTSSSPPKDTERRDLRGWLPPVRRWICAGVDFLYPQVCPFCRAECSRELAEHSAGFCPACWEAMSNPQTLACLRCGGTVGPHQDREAGCYYCRDEHFSFARVIRLGVYRDQLGAACARIKGPAVRLASALGRLTWKLHETEFQAEQIDGVVPIPRRWWQAFQHPHHAAETLATVWGGCLQAPVLTSILKKVRGTPQQTTLSPTERRKNLRNAFAAEVPPAWQGKTLLLADDVMTTGTTVQEATKVLLQAGIGRVIVAVVGRGLGQRQLPR